jgi:hypothetical protein
LVGLLDALPALADETPIEIDTDLDGDYFIVEKGGTENMPVVVVKRVEPDVTYYVKREFDCQAHSVRYLGEAESLEAMAASEPERETSAISAGSISDQLAKYVCPEPEAPTEAPTE